MRNNELRSLRIEWIKKAKYNRKVNEKQARRIAKNFDDRLFGNLVVSCRDEQYYILDGQHRLAAAAMIGRSKVPCIVIFDLTEKEEAALYLQYNKERTALVPLDYFKARCIAGDPLAIEIRDTVDEAGMTFSGGLHCIYSIEQLFKRYGKQALLHALLTVSDAWPGNRQALQANIIHALTKFIRENAGKVEVTDLARRLSTVNIGNFLAESRNAITGKFDPDKSSDVLKAIYNKRRRRGRI